MLRGCCRIAPSARHTLAGVLAVGLALLSHAAAAEPITVRMRAVALDTETPGTHRVGRLEFLAGFVLHADDPRFGGLSGLTLGDGGRALTAVSDHGWWLTARLVLAPDGRLTALRDAALSPIKDLKGRPVRIKDATHDAEAVERLAGGGYAVSFERHHRLWRYAAPAAPAEPLVAFPALAALPYNGGVEAVAALADGRLLLLAEEGYDDAGDHLGWLWRAGQAKRLSYASVGTFKPTDMAPLPDGDVLVLERRFSVLGGAGARIVRLPGAEIVPGALLQGREIARLEWPLVVDNFEGLAVAPAPGGGTLVYLLSDDNYNLLQQTLLLQFRLTPE